LVLNTLLLGRCGYEEALEIQYKVLEKRQQNGIADTLILVEHPPVITLGRQALPENITVSEKVILDQGIDIYRTNRGGDVTYHGYGQIVGYPIVNLREKRMGIRQFVESLEEVFIELLEYEYSIQAGRNPEHTGVWVGDEKIAAIGLAVKKSVTMHGFAFNVNTWLEHFNLIVPCGIKDKGVTSLQHLLNKRADMEAVSQLVLKYFVKILRYEGYKVIN